MPTPNPTRVASIDVTLLEADTAIVTVDILDVGLDERRAGEFRTVELATPYGSVTLAAPGLDGLWQLADRVATAVADAIDLERLKGAQ